MDDSAHDRVKVCFRFEPDEDGWPPVRIEGVWAIDRGHGEYELDNIPWFALDVACGDRVRAEPDDDGVLWVRERVTWSGNYTVRVIPFEDGSSEEAQLQRIIDAFVPLGADCEGALPAHKIVALDIPPTARLAEIKALLDQGEKDGHWDYEEACIDEVWTAL